MKSMKFETTYIFIYSALYSLDISILNNVSGALWGTLDILH